MNTEKATMMSSLRTMFRQWWRIGMVAAVLAATAGSAIAQIPGDTLQLPSTLFDGNSSSRIVYAGSASGALTVNAAATQLNPKGSTDIYLIVTQFSGPIPADASGNCPGGYYYVEGSLTTTGCYTDLGPTSYAP